MESINDLILIQPIVDFTVKTTVLLFKLGVFYVYCYNNTKTTFLYKNVMMKSKTIQMIHHLLKNLQKQFVF